jgi:hypothetical protein
MGSYKSGWNNLMKILNLKGTAIKLHQELDVSEEKYKPL